MSETSKIRHRILHLCEGKDGVDLGCGDDKLSPDISGVDRVWRPGVDVIGDVRYLLWLKDNSLDFVWRTWETGKRPFESGAGLSSQVAY